MHNPSATQSAGTIPHSSPERYPQHHLCSSGVPTESRRSPARLKSPLTRFGRSSSDMSSAAAPDHNARPSRPASDGSPHHSIAYNRHARSKVFPLAQIKLHPVSHRIEADITDAVALRALWALLGRLDTFLLKYPQKFLSSPLVAQLTVNKRHPRCRLITFESL